MHKLSSAMFLLVMLGIHTCGFAKHAAIDILILGDSLSAAHNIPVDKGWPRLFSDNIRSSFPQTSVVNASISGETTYGGLQRLPQLLDEHRPSHLIIELGGNDGLRGLSFGQSTENIRQMVRLARDRGITVLLIGVRMPPNFGAVYNARFQRIFEDIAIEFSIPYLPRFLEGVAGSDPALMQSDGIHPTAIAQPILAQKVEKKMIEILNH
ncbi:MAG: arylesterase [Gammaproteobacteria bacterium]|nr:arylesterase [Gammaproteobacteria bacterium]MDH3446698.1 arylesterase [Gammaproteobacteria bacterium]